MEARGRTRRGVGNCIASHIEGFRIMHRIACANDHAMHVLSQISVIQKTQNALDANVRFP